MKVNKKVFELIWKHNRMTLWLNVCLLFGKLCDEYGLKLLSFEIMTFLKMHCYFKQVGSLEMILYVAFCLLWTYNMWAYDAN